MRPLRVLLSACCLAAAASAGAELTHTGQLAGRGLDVRYRPGSRAAANAERDAAMAGRDLERIAGLLEWTPEGRFTLFLYDDATELALITGVKGVGGFSTGRESHLPYGDDQTRFHEMVHLVAAQLPRSGSEARGMFLAEGLANALLEHVHGVHVHAVAKHYRSRGEIPALSTFLRGDFYGWLAAHPGFNAYDVAGSFVRHLIDAHGIRKVKAYYTGTPADQAFGSGEAALERSWQKAVDAYEVRPEVETLLRQRRGEAARFTVHAADPDLRLPEELLGKPKQWKALAGEPLAPRDKTTWEREGESIRASNAGAEWHLCDVGTRRYRDCAVRARIRTEGILGGVQIQLGEGCCALVVANGTFVYRNGTGSAMSAQMTVPSTGEIDLLLVRRGQRMEVWVDGFRLAEGEVDDTPAPVAIGFHAGQATFTGLRVRELR